MEKNDAAMGHITEIESLLETRLGAEGRSLYEKLSSVKYHLPSELFEPLRQIATIRNMLVHEAGYQIDDYENFIRTCEEILDYLRAAVPVHSVREYNDAATEERMRQFLPTVALPCATLFSMIAASLAWDTTGDVGISIVFGVIGAAIGFPLFSKTAVKFYMDRIYAPKD